MTARLRALIAAALTAALLSPATGNTPADADSGLTLLGGDLSSLQRSLELGATYLDAKGTRRDPVDILAELGMNAVRLRVWNNPRSGYNNPAKVAAYARTVKSRGLKLVVDLHYADSWADPGKQPKPAAWASHSIGTLQKDVYDYTRQLCSTLVQQGTPPDAIQIGNEINVGMLWDDGKVVNNNFTNLGLLLKQGYQAVKDCRPQTQVIIHTADADNLDHARWFYDGIRAAGVKWDVTGLSYYCQWHGTTSNLTKVISDVRSRYGVPVWIMETAYQFTTYNADKQGNTIDGSTLCNGFPASWKGQADEFADVLRAARSGGASGVFYWEPTWTAVAGNGWDPTDIQGTGDGWDNMAVFDATGHLNPNFRWSS